MNAKKNLLLVAMGLVLAGGAVGGASATTTGWRVDHPRRAEVNHRLNIQSSRIDKQRHEGKLTAAQAHRLHVADHRIREQEIRFARLHGGHITRAEQRRLNHEENGVSRRISG
jgi:hypothetical protein